MALFDNMKEKASALAKEAANKTNEMVEVTKLKGKIKEQQELIERAKIQIGEHYFEKYLTSGEAEDSIRTILTGIQAAQAEIETLEAAIETAKERH